MSALRSLWIAISHAGTVAWLWSVGGGFVLGVASWIAGAAAGLEGGQLALLVPGVAMLGTAAVGTAIAKNPSWLKSTQPQPEPEPASEPVKKEEDERADTRNMSRGAMEQHLAARYGEGCAYRQMVALWFAGSVSTDRQKREVKVHAAQWADRVFQEVLAFDRYYFDMIEGPFIVEQAGPTSYDVYLAIDRFLASVDRVARHIANVPSAEDAIAREERHRAERERENE